MEKYRFKLMRKFYRGSRVSPKDDMPVEEMQSTGILGRPGLHEEEDGTFSQTAKITSLGQELYGRERKRINPIRRVIDSFFHN